jgi:hypothetical protein
MRTRTLPPSRALDEFTRAWLAALLGLIVVGAAALVVQPLAERLHGIDLELPSDPVSWTNFTA